MLEVIRDCFGFAPLRYLIGLENSPYHLNQSHFKHWLPGFRFYELVSKCALLWSLICSLKSLLYLENLLATIIVEICCKYIYHKNIYNFSLSTVSCKKNCHFSIYAIAPREIWHWTNLFQFVCILYIIFGSFNLILHIWFLGGSERAHEVL